MKEQIHPEHSANPSPPCGENRGGDHVSIDSPLLVLLRTEFQILEEKISEAGPVCELSGRCCRFEEYGHRLYLTRTEADLLFSEGLPDDSRIEPGSCPFQKGNICTAREKRPFGCRVYFCDPRYVGKAEPWTEDFLARFKTAHETEGADWEYADLFYWLQKQVASRATV